MTKKKGAQTVEVITGRKIVLSSGVGKTNIDELNWLTETVLASASAWKHTGWAYVADCSKMDPVSPAEGGVLVTMTQKFVEAGCKAFAFAEGNSIMLKVQAKKNTERSKTGVAEAHFATCSRSKLLTKLLKTFDKDFREIFSGFRGTKRRAKPSAFFDNNFVNNAYFSVVTSSSSLQFASSTSKALISSLTACLCSWSF